MNTRFLSFKTGQRLSSSATGAIARFSGSLAASAFQWNTLRFADTSLLHRRALPGSRKNAHSHLFNRGF